MHDTTIEEMAILRGALAHKQDAEKRIENLTLRLKSLTAAVVVIEEALRLGPGAALNVETLIVARKAISDEQMGWTK